MFNIKLNKVLMCAIAMLLVACAVLAPATESARAENTPPTVLDENGFKYTIDATTDTAILQGYTGTATEVEIPKELGGKKVTKIGCSAFFANTTITSVIIPEGVTSIEDGGDSNVAEEFSGGAFMGCIALSSVLLPESLTYIGINAFNDCSALKSITIPDAVTNLGYQAFHGAGLNSVKLPSKLNTIANSAFADCKLTEITIPESVTTICSDAFSSNKSLTQITLPKSVTTLEPDIFMGCTGLKTVNILGNITYIPDRMFYECTSLTDVNLPDSVTEIGAGAFANCTSLKSIKLPPNLTTIGLIGQQTDVNLLAPGAFSACTSLEAIEIPAGVTKIGDYTFDECKSLKTIVFPAKVNMVGQRILEACTALENTKFFGNAPTTTSVDNDPWQLGTGLKDTYETLYLKGVTDYPNMWGGYPTKAFTVDTPDPDKPGADNPDKPGTDNPDKPGTDNPDKPGTDNPNNPGTDNPDKPGTDNPDKPGTDNPDKPGTDNPDKPSTDNPVTPPADMAGIAAPSATINGKNVTLSANHDIVIDGTAHKALTGFPKTNRTGAIKAADIKNLFNAPAGTSIEMTAPDGTVLTDDAIAGTGAFVKLKDAAGNVLVQHPIIIPGDITGSGKVDLADYAKIIAHRLNITPLDGLSYVAADLNGDGTISIIDIAFMKAIRLGRDV